MKSYIRYIVLSLVLICMTIACSGCFTALGAIIGYQSGELVAGALIGAGIDTGIVISDKLEENSEDLAIELDKGKISARIAGNGPDYIKYVEEAFDAEGWGYKLESKKIRKNNDCEAKWQVGDYSKVKLAAKKDRLVINIESKVSTEKEQYTGKLAELLKDKFGH